MFYLQVPYKKGLEDFYYICTLKLDDYRVPCYQGTLGHIICKVTIEDAIFKALNPQKEFIFNKDL